MTQRTQGFASVAVDNTPPSVAREAAKTNEQTDDFAALLATLFVTPAPAATAPQAACDAPETQLQIIDDADQTGGSPRGTMLPFTFVNAAVGKTSQITTDEVVATGQAALNAEHSIVDFAANGNFDARNISTQSVTPHQLAAILADAKANRVGGNSQSSLDPSATLESHGLVTITDGEASHVAAPTAAIAAAESTLSFAVEGFSPEDLRANRRLISATEINSLLGSEDAKPIDAADASSASINDDASTFVNSINARSGESFGAAGDHAPAVVSQTASALAAEFASLANSKTADARSLQLDLNPESLGHIAIRLERDAEGNISAHLSADTDATHKTLSDSLGELRRTLEDAGINVARLDIGANSNPGANAGSTDEREAQARARTIDATTPIVTAAPEQQQRAAIDDRLLSLRA